MPSLSDLIRHQQASKSANALGAYFPGMAAPAPRRSLLDVMYEAQNRPPEQTISRLPTNARRQSEGVLSSLLGAVYDPYRAQQQAENATSLIDLLTGFYSYDEARNKGDTLGATLATLGAIPIGGAVERMSLQEIADMIRAGRMRGIPAFKGDTVWDWRTRPVRQNGRIIENADPAGWKLREQFDAREIGHPWAGFFSSDPETANRFAQVFSGRNLDYSDTAVYPVNLDMTDARILDAQGLPAAAYQFDMVGNQHGIENARNDFLRTFEEYPGGLVLLNTKDEGHIFVPRDPRQIQSAFAPIDLLGKAAP